MKQKQKNKIIFSIAILFFIGFFNVSYADLGNLDSNTTSSYEVSGQNADIDPFGLGSGHIQILGTGLDSTINGFIIDIVQKGSDSSLHFKIYERDNENFSDINNNISVFQQYYYMTEGEHFYSFDKNINNDLWTGDSIDLSTFTFNPNKYYYLLFSDNTTSFGTREIRSSTIDNNIGYCSKNCGSATDLSFILTETYGGLLYSEWYDTNDLLLENNDIIDTEFFNDVYVDIYGNNPIGLFNSIEVKVLENSFLLENIVFNDVLNTACFNCLLYSFNLADIEDSLDFGFIEHNLYGFEISMVSDLTSDKYTLSRFSLWNGEEIPIFENCSLDNLGGCIIDVLKYLFIPREQVFNRFTEFKELLESKPPFAYATQLFDLLDNFQNNNNNKFVLEQVEPITDNIFTPIKTGLSWLLWFAFAFVLFIRFRNITI